MHKLDDFVSILTKGDGILGIPVCFHAHQAPLMFSF